jgi:AcrR family transcriptional regulator
MPKTRTAGLVAVPTRSGRVGRPAKISRDDIAKAAHEIGMDELTLKAVADELGVSVAGLYHHIDGKDDLLRLAAEYSATRAELPQDRGQHWSIWLMEWAIYNRDAFVSQPGLLKHYIDGAVSAEAIVDNIDGILGVLVRQGFGPRQALEAYRTVSTSAIGWAVSTLHEAATVRNGQPQVAEYHRVLAQRDPAELVHLRALIAELATSTPPTFVETISTLITGVAVERGDDPVKVRRRIKAAKLDAS